ncbi:MAG: electron transport complex subunit E [Oscillospiraceae bacterium]|jgi:electron transport complex protein RnfE|nr:electron transport complex subunit E [Oscillospiraceae bacterium]
MAKTALSKEFSKGILRENPVLRLVLGTCPTLAVTSSAVNALGMGIAVLLVLICANVTVSALRKIIPDKLRIPAYIVVIASFTSVVQMLVKAFVPALDVALGVFLPLITVNCILLGRAEAFAGQNPVLASAADGAGMGVGFTAALLCMGTVREILGAGTFLSGAQSLLGVFGENTLGGFNGWTLLGEGNYLAPIAFFIMAPGGLLVFGLLIALSSKIGRDKAPPSSVCGNCPMAATCHPEEASA